MLQEKYEKILEIQDITIACQEMKKIRNTYKNTQSLPIWFRQNYKTQTQLLQEMGLVKDIFRKTHWNMYSPDRKAQQK